jgi:hypothetical protein
MSWFKTIFGREPGSEQRYPPALRINQGETVTVKFLEAHPRVTETQFGDRAVIIVSCNGEKRSLWLMNVDLAEKIAILEQKLGSLENVTVQIKNMGKKGRRYVYDVQKL